MHVPRCQDGPILTSEGMRESEELQMRKGSIGMGARQLFSDMQAGTNDVNECSPWHPPHLHFSFVSNSESRWRRSFSALLC